MNKEDRFYKIVLTIIAVGVWVLILQNMGYLGQQHHIRGSVWGSVEVDGGHVSIDN